VNSLLPIAGKDMQKKEEELANLTDGWTGILSHKAKGVGDLMKVAVPNPVRTVKSHSKKVYCASWCEDALHIVSCSQDGSVLVTNASSGLITKMPIKSPFVMQCAARLDAGLVACGGMHNLVEIHNITEHKPVKKKDFEGHEGYISSLKFLDDGAKLMSGSGDGLVKTWDMTKMCLINTWTGHEQDVSGVAMCNEDPNMFATSSTDKSCRVWDLRQPYAVRKFACKYSANCIAMMPNARGIIVGCDNASWEFYDVGSNTQVARGKVKKGRCESVAISSSGRFVYLGWDTSELTVADCYIPDNQKPMNKDMSKNNHQDSICNLETAPDGSALLSSSFDATAKVWGCAPSP